MSRFYIFVVILYFLFLQMLHFYLQAHYNNGEYIIRQGARGDTFYIIAKGKVRSKNCNHI